MDITNLPALSLVTNAPFSQTYAYLQPDETPVDMGDWVGEAVFTRDNRLLLQLPVELGDDGSVRLVLDIEQVNSLTGPRINFQINLTPTGFDAPTEVWRGQVVVQ